MEKTDDQFLWGQEYGALGPLLPPGPCITKVRAVHVCDITLSMFSVGVGLLNGCSFSIILFDF